MPRCPGYVRWTTWGIALIACSTEPARDPATADKISEHTRLDVIQDFQQVDLRECYFLPPAGDARVHALIQTTGIAEQISFNKEHSYVVNESEAGQCIIARLSGIQTRARGRRFYIWVNIPHAVVLDDVEQGLSTKVPFDTKDVVRRVESVDLKGCSASGTEERVYLSVLIHYSGAVMRVLYEPLELRNAAIGKCIADRISTLRIAPFTGGRLERVEVTVRVP